MAKLSPDGVLVVFTLSLLLIYLEFNRPGSIVFGAAGLLGTLLSIAAFSRFALSPVAVVLVCTAVALLALDLVRPTHVLISVAATLALILGCSQLVKGPDGKHIHAGLAAVCGVILGSGTSVLARIARRARTNKRLD
jgi:membrane-bound serine protease (ClpP class)